MNEFENENYYLEESEDSSTPKKKKFNIFDWYYKKEGKGINDDGFNPLKEPTFKNFFKLLWRKLGKLMSGNMFFILVNFPIVFLITAMSGVLTSQSTAPLYQSMMTLNAASLYGSTPQLLTYFSLYGINTSISAINTPTLVFFLLGFLTIFTWGFSKVGTTYVYRNLMKGEAVFPFADAWYIIKKNVKKCLIFGILDFIFIAMFVYNISFLLLNYNTAVLNSFMFFFTLIMCMLFFFMRPYIYLMIFTFNLSVGKIIKNAFYFIVLGVKRNFACLLFTVLVVVINFALFRMFMPIGIILPFVITFALIDMIGVYCAFPIVKKYMIDPQTK